MTRRAKVAHASRHAVFALLCVLASAALVACGGGGGSAGAGGNAGAGATAAGAASGGTAGKAAEATTAATGAPFAQPASLTIPQISGEAAGGTLIDVSGVNDGYVCAAASSASRLKFQVAKDGETYNYDLPNDGTPIVAPVNMGSGSYNFRIMQNTEGSSYVELDAQPADVALASEFAPFLVPNMFCDYDTSSACVAKARELTSGAANQAEAVSSICVYLTENITYDKAKAEQLATQTGYVPDPDSTLASGTGICFDYASLGAAMMRSQGLPAKVITGYVDPGEFYHAWIMVYVDGEWKTAQFVVDRNTWSRLDITFAASGATEFTGSGTGYTDRYTY